ncbi:ABC-type metal ion transport system, periplasmic component/surface adhesin [Synechococcus sp. PCC 6312]|nr:ABC-type metal ion transport system, periplasmic component/surface adhesin [Synechococcus sp. PCC 6312]
MTKPLLGPPYPAQPSRKFFKIVTTVGMMSMIAGCQGEPPTANAPAESKIKVITTFLPMTQFTKAVAGDRAEVIQLLPTNVGPHDYQARPGDVQRLTQANVLVKNGLEMESFLDNIIANAENPNLKVINTSQGVKTITSASIRGEADDHDQVHDHNHSEAGTTKSAEGHHHGEFNPHIWLDPKRAIVQVENIRNGLIAADPGGEAIYQANAAAFIAQLQSLDQDIATQLQPFQGKTFVVFHDFASYFAQSYNLKATYLVDIPEDNPSPADVSRITKAVDAANLRAILTEPQANENTFAALAQDLKVKISIFDPMETGPETAAEPSYYLNTMRKNAQDLTTAFGGNVKSQQINWLRGHLAILPAQVRQSQMVKVGF